MVNRIKNLQESCKRDTYRGTCEGEASFTEFLQFFAIGLRTRSSALALFLVAALLRACPLSTVQVDLLGVQPRLRGGGLSRDYQAAQFHFHWGATDDRGSEHALDNKHYPMEVRAPMISCYTMYIFFIKMNGLGGFMIQHVQYENYII